jgi:hypothetical protein
MAQGDAYIYHWTSYNNNNLTLTPSSGVEWMFVSSVCSRARQTYGGVGLNTTGSGSSYTAEYLMGAPDSSTAYGHPVTASGGAGLSTFNMKLLATNSYPLRYFQQSESNTIYSRFMAIVINE